VKTNDKESVWQKGKLNHFLLSLLFTFHFSLFTFHFLLSPDKRNTSALVGNGQSRAAVADFAVNAPSVTEVQAAV